MFKLDKTLANDTFFITDLKLCSLLLLNNRFYPWLVLVPKVQGVTEVFELSEENQSQLSKEINQISKLSKELFKADKINIAAFGNVVSQLHIHIIARYKNDRTFPSPVWLDKSQEKYSEDNAKEIIQKIKLLLS